MQHHHTVDKSESHEFRKELGLLSSTMIVIGSMVGSGIFIVSADIARTVGSPGLLLVTWVVTGIFTVIAALSYGELAGMMPQAGGQYVYLREAWNPLVGFLFGWTLFLVIQSGSIAAVAVAFAKFTAVFFPSLGDTNVLFSLIGRDVTAAQLVAIASVIVLTAVNIRGVREGKIVQDIFTVLKIGALLLIIVLGFTVGYNAVAVAMNFGHLWTASWTHMSDGSIVSVEALGGLMIPAAIGVAMVGTVFSLDAWNNITFTAGEVINPRRTIPLSLVIGSGVVAVLYVAVNLAYLVVLPLAGSPDAADTIGRGMQFATSDRVSTAMMSVIFGAPGEYIMAALIMVSTFGCNNGMILAGARVYYAMARDGLFFAKAGTLNRNGVPAWALVVQAAWTILLCLSGSYGDLLDYVVSAVLIFYILSIAGIFRLRRTRPNDERPYRAFGYPVLPALYIAIALLITTILLIFKPQFTWPGMLIVLLGVPVFYVWRKFRPQ
ncbi:MAG: amino acid permease [Bacteroidota bacterium]|jgi:APA family basic amino acid/polyamine antiporter